MEATRNITPGLEPDDDKGWNKLDIDRCVSQPGIYLFFMILGQLAVAESKRYFDGDELAATVWVSKYALKDSFGNIYEKSPREMHERIAAEIERIERKYPSPMSKEEAFALLDHFRYVIPQGGPMTGIGNNFQLSFL